MEKGLSIMIPVYNEEEILVKNTKRLIKFLDKLKLPYEILICDNGSTDNTQTLGKKLQSQFPKKVKFLSIPESRSVGFAFKKMVEVSSFNNLISLDMDLSVNFEYFIPKCLELLKNNSMVIGSKMGKQKRPFYRKIVSNIFIFLVKILLGLEFSDYSIGAKGYRKDHIIDKLDAIDRGTFYVIKLIYFLKKEDLRITEIPVKVYDVRKSRFNIFQDAINRGINLLNFLFRERIIKIISKIPK
jgi:undecaprenyl-phosphate 4-deoxy-4-formamido-L-arabinose transferase